MTIILQTPRLLLRTLSLDDADVMLRELNNFAITRNTARVPFPYHRDDAVSFLEFVETLDGQSCVAGIEIKSSPGELVGIISFEWSESKSDAELGYWLSEAVWGKGYGTEAARAMVEHAFVQRGHAKMVACYHDDNPVSGRILFGLGFNKTGACSNFSKAQQRDVPVTNVQLLKSDWQKQKAAL